MGKVKEILYKQLELLAEESKKEMLPDSLARISQAMVEIVKTISSL